MDWKLAEAKARLSELVSRTLDEGPQRILRRNDAVVVLSEEEFRRLTGARLDFVEFLASAPRLDDLELPPRDGAMREVDL
ncbi:Phd_YefM [Planctomycetes bacterium Pla163]|uniref:Antitoxin n=1 Tax=Rohdeia mirabilis TaxID=2528008 RepID=A0A518CVJ6_9BACT|nr:Phd_YefM [Planctomycetes bacterium Pla163]